jgi:AraC-like DNA-binding protein
MTACALSPDPVSEVLRAIRLEDTCYCRSELSAPWGIAIPERPYTSFHFVAEGAAWLLAGGAPVALGRGDMAFVLRGRRHAIASDPRARTVALESLSLSPLGHASASVVHGGRGASSLLLCGKTRFSPDDHPLHDALPPVIIHRDAADRSAFQQLAIATMRQEAATMGPGSDTFLTRLAELLFIEAVRGWMQGQAGRQAGWLTALQDERLGRVLALLHRDPACPHTIATLAAHAGMSKSVFCERFRATVGTPPLRYATRLRMALAAQLLREPGATTAGVAERLGYGSEAAFGRAFKRHLGTAPGAVRRRGRVAPPPSPGLAAGA